jgi:hypothetical protein
MVESVIISGVSIFIFVLGILVHKHFMCGGIPQSYQSSSFLNKTSNQTQANKVALDESKVVLKIDTRDMEKMSEVSVNTKITEDNTQNAINKLKNLKGK